MRYRFQYGDQVFDILLERQGDRYVAQLAGESYELEVLDSQPGQLSLRFAGQTLTLYWANDGSQKWVSLNGCTYHLEKPASRRQHSNLEVDANAMVRSPMPAQVRAVQIAEGDPVSKGQALLLLEAMKMEIQIKAPSDGRALKLMVKEGQAVDKDQILVEIGE